MPRRGEHQSPFLRRPSRRAGGRPHRHSAGAGSRPNRTVRDIMFDPNEFRCVRLAGELADEWVDYAETSRISGAKSVSLGRRASATFCTSARPRCSVRTAHRASLAQPASRRRGRCGRLGADPSRAASGPARPPRRICGQSVRALIARRARHDQRPVTAGCVAWSTEPRGVALRHSQESTNSPARTNGPCPRGMGVGASAGCPARGRMDIRRPRTRPRQVRLGRRRQPALGSGHPTGLPSRDLHQPAPGSSVATAVAGLHRVSPISPSIHGLAKIILVSWLVGQLYPRHLDLHAYRVLLVAATGYTPEEVTALTDTDVEFLPTGVRLTLTKQRAQRVRHRTFGTDPSPDNDVEAIDFTDRPHREVGAIIRQLIARHRASIGRRRPMLPVDCLSRRRLRSDYQLRIAPWATNNERSRFADWLAAARVAVDGAPDIRRLRKSTKVEKAIAFGGRIADAANDHHEEVFRGHYAQGTTLRVMSGRVITDGSGPLVRQGAGRTDRAHQIHRSARCPGSGGGAGPAPDNKPRHPPRSTRHGTDPMLGSAQLALRPVGRVVPGGAVAVSGMPQRLDPAQRSTAAVAVRRPPRPAAAAVVPAALRRSCGDRATPICTPCWPSALMKRKRWPASTSRPVRSVCICRWPRTWSLTVEPRAIERPAQRCLQGP